MLRNLVLMSSLVLAISVSGCARSHPGNYAQPEVEAQVMKSLKLSEIQITPDPAGGYTGTGKTAEGETYKLKITQDEAMKRLSWNAVSDRGNSEDGKYEFE